MQLPASIPGDASSKAGTCAASGLYRAECSALKPTTEEHGNQAQNLLSVVKTLEYTDCCILYMMSPDCYGPP